MKTISRTISLLTLVVLLSTAPSAFAAENAFREVFLDAFYGGAAGTLAGLALTIFSSKPGDHMDYLATGAAAGILVGTGYGVAKSTRALAEWNNGKVRIAIPKITADPAESPATHQTFITWRADILHGTFN